MIELIIIILSSVASISGISFMGKISSLFGLKLIKKYSEYRRAKRKMKKGIMRRDYRKFIEGVDLLKIYDINYRDEKLQNIMKLYNLNNKILEDEMIFNRFYQISLYEKLSNDELMDIVEKYAEENEMSVIRTDTLIGGIDL